MTNPHTLSARLHRGVSAFDALQQSWQDAVDRADGPSLFMTPVFIRQSWDHFHKPGDEPWLVSVEDTRGRMVGLLPLVLRTEVRRLVRIRTLMHMGLWAGDRPGVLHTRDTSAGQIWCVALSALLERRAAWHHLDLREVEEVVLPDLQAQLQQEARLSVSIRPDTYAGLLPTTGIWEHYFDSRSRHTRQAYRRSHRLLTEACPGLRVETIDQPADMPAAFERYLAIEQLGWKHSARVGLWADDRQVAFHRALLPWLARTGQASIWFLCDGEHDIAGLVRLRQGTVTYERFKAFDPAHARSSPGTWLCAQALQQSFESRCTLSDVLGMHTPLAERQAVNAWYDRELRTVRLVVTRAGTGQHLLRRTRQALRAVRRLHPQHWRHGAQTDCTEAASPDQAVALALRRMA